MCVRGVCVCVLVCVRGVCDVYVCVCEVCVCECVCGGGGLCSPSPWRVELT